MFMYENENNQHILKKGDPKNPQYFLDEFGTYCDLGGYIGGLNTGTLVSFSGTPTETMKFEFCRLCFFDGNYYTVIKEKGNEQAYISRIYNFEGSQHYDFIDSFDYETTQCQGRFFRYIITESTGAFKYTIDNGKPRVYFKPNITVDKSDLLEMIYTTPENLTDTYVFEFENLSENELRLFTSNGKLIEDIPTLGYLDIS